MSSWVLVCDASVARIFSLPVGGVALKPVRDIANPLGRARATELVSDEPGRISKGGTRGMLSAMDPRTTPHQVELERHARHLAKVLKDALDEGQFDSLTIIAPPRLLGMLKALLDPQVLKCLRNSIAKDLVHADEEELVRHLPSL